MFSRDQGMISSTGTSREHYEVGQQPIMALPHQDAPSMQNLSPSYTVVEGARKDYQHSGSRHNLSSNHPAGEGARKDEQYSNSYHNFSPPRSTVGGSRKDEQHLHHDFSPHKSAAGGARKDEQYLQHNLSPHRATVGGAIKDEQYSCLNNNFSPCQATVEGARIDEQYSRSRHNINRHHAAAEEARLNKDRDTDMRKYEMCRRQDIVDQFHSSPRGPRSSVRLEQRSPVHEREVYRISQLSRRYDDPKYAVHDEAAISSSEHGYGYKNTDYRQMSTSKHDSIERRLCDHDSHGASANNVFPLKETMDSHAARQPHADYLLAPDYRKSSQRFSPVQRQSFRKESDYYWNETAPGHSAMEEYYEKKEKYVNESREYPHPSSFTSNYRDSGHQQMLIQGYPGVSSGLDLRGGLGDAFPDVNTAPPLLEHSRNYGNLTEPKGANEYCPRAHLGPRKDHRVGYVDMKYHQYEDYGRTCSKHEDYLHDNSGGHKNDPQYISNEILYREASTHGRAEPESGYIPRPVVREPTTEGGMHRSDALDNYNDPNYISNDFVHGKAREHVRRENDHIYSQRAVAEDPIADTGLVVTVDNHRTLGSHAGGNEDEPDYMINDGFYSVVPVHDQTERGHRYLRRQVIEEPIAQSDIVEGEGFRRIHRSSAGSKEDGPNYISKTSMFRAEPDYGYIERAVMEEPISQFDGECFEGSQRLYQSSAMREYDIVRDKEVRKLDTLNHSKYYLDFEDKPADLVRMPEENHRSFELCFRPEDEIYADDQIRYGNARSERDRFKSNPEFIENLGTERVIKRVEKMEFDEQFANDRPLKRKYRHDEEVSRINSGSQMLRKGHATCDAQDVGGQAGHQGHRSSGGGGLHSNEQSRNNSNFYLEAEEIFDEIYCHEDYGRHNWSSSHRGKWENEQEQNHRKDFGRHNRSSSHRGKWKNVPEQDRKPHESGRKYLKGYLKSESSTRYDRPLHLNKKSHSYKPHNFVDRSSEGGGHKDVKQVANLAKDEDEDLPTHNPIEDSEAFKQKVNGAFLIFSKKLNENTPLRKLYKDQGRSDTLFCIVCGRSASKEFQDSEQLARHAYMSQKAGLRHQHLGLFRAICVSMGWNTEVPKDVVTWLPQPLPHPMAMTLKEDLILWQPVVIIHNISLSNNNHKEWKVISIDALSEIIRGKGFTKSRINISLGCPGDQSVLVVKFMGTYSGLLEAEKLHKYFAESGRGRKDFEEAISNMSKSSGSEVLEATNGETLNDEALLYGYMGIAEDLDRIDLDTQRRCKIKSKQEIQGIADASLKTE